MGDDRSYRDLFSLDGKIAVVTGGAGMLGRRFCRGLADFGASVAVVDIDGDAAATVAAEVASASGVRAVGVACDVSDPASVSAMADRVEADLGRVDVLHNNAASKSSDAAGFFTSTEEFDISVWREITAVNLDGMFLVAREVGSRMAADRRGGSIVQTASIYGIMAPDQRIYEGSEYMGHPMSSPAVYSASKAGVVGLTKYLAAYWGEAGVRVNTLTPGGVASGQSEEFMRRYSARVPMGRMAEGDEMVGALVFLASDASSYVTGHNIVVDGGLSAW